MTPGTQPDADPLGSAARISRAAERDAARDRRVLWLYLALSVIPVILALAFLRYGRTDRRMIEAELAPVKTQIEEVQPALREVKALGSLASDVRALSEVAGEVRGTVARVEEHGRQLQRLEETTAQVVVSREAEFRKLEDTLVAVRAQLRTLEETQGTIERNQARIDALERRIAPVERDLREIRRRPPRD